jgi:hypothetical protein
MEQTATLQAAIELIDSLSLEDQTALVELLQNRVRHQMLVREVEEIRQDFAQGNIKFGTVADFLAEIDE